MFCNVTGSESECHLLNLLQPACLQSHFLGSPFGLEFTVGLQRFYVLSWGYRRHALCCWCPSSDIHGYSETSRADLELLNTTTTSFIQFLTTFWSVNVRFLLQILWLICGFMVWADVSTCRCKFSITSECIVCRSIRVNLDCFSGKKNFWWSQVCMSSKVLWSCPHWQFSQEGQYW